MKFLINKAQAVKTIKIAAISSLTIVSTNLVFAGVFNAQAVELPQLTDERWDEYTSDNTRFDGKVWTTGSCKETEDERSKTPPKIADLYTELSEAAVGARYPMTAGYIYDKSYLCGQKKRHAGIDIGAPENTTVTAVIGGRVAWVGKDFFGIDGTDNKHWVYGHVKNILIKPNQLISPEQELASINAADHLHLEVQKGHGYKKTYGASTDLDFLKNSTISPLQAFWSSRNDGDTTNTSIPFAQPVLSRLNISKTTVDLTINGSDLAGRTVYATLCRPAFAGFPEKCWKYSKVASTDSVTFSDMEGDGDTFAGVNYYSIASLTEIPETEALKLRTSCFNTTDGRFLCDMAGR